MCGRVRSVAVLGQLSSAEEAVRVELAPAGRSRRSRARSTDSIWYVDMHLAEHHERARADDLDVDVTLVHVGDVTGCSGAVLLFGEPASAR